GQTVIDDFNGDFGHFTWGPGQSGSASNVGGTSEISTDNPLEGSGLLRLGVTATTPGAAQRDRFVSGGAAPGNNVLFDTTGFVGYYLRTTQSGLTTGIALDGSGNTGAEMNMGAAKPVIDDGEWHLYEWDL